MLSAFYSNYKSDPKINDLRFANLSVTNASVNFGTFIKVTYANLDVESMFDNGLHLCVLNNLTSYDVD